MFNIFYFYLGILKFNITLLVTATLSNEVSSEGLEQATLVTFLLFNHDCSQMVMSHERQF